MAARAYWQGQIRLALVSIPVEAFAAVKSGAKISFNQIHEPSGKRVRYEKVADGIGPVDWSELEQASSAALFSIDDTEQLLERAQAKSLAGWGFADQRLPDA